MEDNNPKQLISNKKFKLIIKKLRKSSTANQRSFSPESVKSNYSSKTIITRKTIYSEMNSSKNKNKQQSSVNSFDSIFKRNRKYSFDISHRNSKISNKKDLLIISEVL